MEIFPTIQIKRGSTAGLVPAGLTYGELAVNVTDAILYVGGTTGETIQIVGGGGGGFGATGATGATGAIPTDYVISLNGLTGAVGLTAGGGINISTSSNNITITNTLHTLIDGGVY
jgi:hypothetical protein